MDDPLGLQRFVDAQAGGVYERALQELLDGCKRTHWMWFVFPQVAGLGRSATARHFAISGRSEARAYLDHPVLGSRLRKCAHVLTELPGADPVEVFGQVDAMKLRSSMTLFADAVADEQVFQEVLDQYFAGEPDPETTSRLDAHRDAT